MSKRGAPSSEIIEYSDCIDNAQFFDAMSIDLDTLMEAIDFARNRALDRGGYWNQEDKAETLYGRVVMTAIRRARDNYGNLSDEQNERYSDILCGAIIAIHDESKQQQAREDAFDYLTPNDRLHLLQDIQDRLIDDLDIVRKGGMPEVGEDEYLDRNAPSLLQRVLPPKADGEFYTNREILSNNIEIHYSETAAKQNPGNPFAGFRCHIEPRAPDNHNAPEL